jgi:hypothetical protein
MRGQLGHHRALLPLHNKWFTIGSTHGLVGFDKAESCFLAISKGDLRIQKLPGPRNLGVCGCLDTLLTPTDKQILVATFLYFNSPLVILIVTFLDSKGQTMSCMWQHSNQACIF